MKDLLRVVAVFAGIILLFVLSPMLIPLIVVGAMVLLAYGLGKATRWW